MLRRKHERRLDDEQAKPLASYRAEELDRMKVNFFGPDRSYHEARRRFVFKGKEPPPESRLAVPATLEQLRKVLLPIEGSASVTHMGLAASLHQSRPLVSIARASC